MASAQESFDAEKMRREMFEGRNRNISTILEFIAETAKVLNEKEREKDFVYITDRSIELLQDNLILKRNLLCMIIIKCDEKLEGVGMLKCLLELEKLFNDSVEEKRFRIDILLEIGTVYFYTTHYRKTIEYTLRAEKIADELNEKSSEVRCCEILGNAYVMLAEYKKAMEYFRKSLEISIRVGNRPGIANNNQRLGFIYFMMNQYEKTIGCCSKGLDISIEIGDQSGIAKNTAILGDAYRCLDQYKKAIDCYSKSIVSNDEIGNQLGIASNTGNLGKAYDGLGQFEKAIKCYRKALEIGIEIGNRLIIASNTRDLGTAHCSLGQYEKAIRYIIESLAISAEIEDQLGIAYGNRDLGSVYASVGQYEKAIECCTKGLSISIEIGNQLGIAQNTVNLGVVYVCLGQYRKAIECCNKSLAISTGLGSKSVIAACNANLGNAFAGMGQYEKAIEYFNKGLEISIEIGSLLEIAKINRSLGTAYFYLGQYEKAISHYSKGLAISSEIEEPPGIADSNGNLGVAYLNMGEYEKAIKYISKGLVICTEIGNRLGIVCKIVNLGRAYLYLGLFEKAIGYFSKGLEISSEIGDMPGIANITGNLGCAYHGLGQYEKAIECYYKSLAITTEIGDQFAIATTKRYLGMANVKMGEYEKAISYYNESLAISTEIGSKSGIAAINESLGIVFCCLGQFGKAIEYSSKALAISIEIGDRCLECIAVGSIGMYYFTLHRRTEDVSKLRKAVSFLKKSVVCGDKILFDLNVDENMISFINLQYFFQYVILMLCFILLKRIEAALLVADLGKAKVLHAFYEKRKKSENVNLGDYTKETWEKINNIEEKVQTSKIEKVLQLKKKNCTILFYAFDCDTFLNIWLLNGKNRIRHKSIPLKKTIIFSYLKELLTPFSVDLSRGSSFYKPDFGVNPRKQKVAEESFGEMFITEKSTDAKNVSKMPSLGFSKNKLSKKFQSRINIFSHKTSDDPLKTEIVKILEHYDLAIDTSSIITPLEALFQILIKPVENFIKGSKLIIVPDAFLFFVPFCALQTENGCPISKDYSIQITPSLHTLCVSTTQSHQTTLGFALFVGNPSVGKVTFRGEQIEPSNLSNATSEAKCLARLFDAKPLVEGEAVKERVLRLIHGASIIHIAAHGDQNCGEIFLAPNPDWSHQGLSLPKEESYLVREKDIIDIRTNALLVVLCCCHTGSGKISSEGVIGVARAFLAAGARSVLATLWPIHDEGTKLFMEYFYNEICKETSVCEALRKTINIFQQHQNEFYRKVQVWAPFTIYGEDVKFSQNDIEEIKQKSREMSF